MVVGMVVALVVVGMVVARAVVGMVVALVVVSQILVYCSFAYIWKLNISNSNIGNIKPVDTQQLRDIYTSNETG